MANTNVNGSFCFLFGKNRVKFNFISQLGEVKRSIDLLAFMELTFGII